MLHVFYLQAGREEEAKEREKDGKQKAASILGSQQSNLGGQAVWETVRASCGVGKLEAPGALCGGLLNSNVCSCADTLCKGGGGRAGGTGGGGRVTQAVLWEAVLER